jgi:hypothetical protein
VDLTGTSVEEGELGYDTSAMLNMALGENAAFRLVGFSAYDAGYIAQQIVVLTDPHCLLGEQDQVSDADDDPQLGRPHRPIRQLEYAEGVGGQVDLNVHEEVGNQECHRHSARHVSGLYRDLVCANASTMWST